MPASETDSLNAHRFWDSEDQVLLQDLVEMDSMKNSGTYVEIGSKAKKH